MKLTFKLSLKTDYHVGSGYGLGTHLDSVLLRDSDGTLVIRSIEQLLRDGMWRLLQLPALSKRYEQHNKEEERREKKEKGSKVLAYCSIKSEEKHPQCPLCWIFGTPAFPKYWNISSARLQGAETPLMPNQLYKNQNTQQVFRNRINLRMKHAEDKKLFSQEEGDRRLNFVFTAETNLRDTILDEAALLVASSRMVRYLGSSRRRGRGECSIDLIEIANVPKLNIPKSDKMQDESSNINLDQNSLLDHFGKWLNDETRQQFPVKFSSNITTNNTQSVKPVRRLVILRIDQPILIARRLQAGNEFDGVDYIQGTTLLGALAKLAVDHCGIESDSSKKNGAYESFVDVFKRNNVVFSPLFIASKGEDYFYPTIPAPLDIFTCQIYLGFAHKRLNKNTNQNAHGTKAYATNPDLPLECSLCHSDKLVNYGDFLSIQETSENIELKKYNGVHTRINPYTQKVAEGNLFNYIALDSGQYFLGEIWCKNEAFWQQLCELTGKINLSVNTILPLKVGKATRRGYGAVTLWIGEFSEIEILRTGVDLSQRVIVNDLESTRISLTLLSDTILVDQWGRSKLTLKDPKWLKQLIGEDVEIKIINCFCQTGYVDGFNNVLGLPQWRDIVIKAGSSIGFEIKITDEIQKRLKKIEESGIGLRRNEGFGQVVFNHPIYNDGKIQQDISIDFPEKLKLLDLSKTNTQIKEFKEETKSWKTRLDTFNTKDFADEKYMAVARWMHHIAGQEPNIDNITSTLEKFGKVWELPGREKKDDKKEITESLINSLIDKLNELKDLKLVLQVQQKAIQMLADKICAASKSK